MTEKKDVSAVLAGALLAALLAWALEAWLLMLLMGGVHASVDEQIPAPSYGGSLILAALLTVVGACLGTTARPEKSSK